MTYDILVITFFIYSILGYIAEVIYCSMGQRKLVNRGFLYGPWLPIYGFGGIIIKLFLEPLSGIYIWGPVLVFVLGMILTSIVEYLGSWMLEKAFSIKLWDYSKKIGNINGRVCLLNSTLFGIGGLAITYLINPHLDVFIARIPDVAIRPTSDTIVLVMTIDFMLSCMKMNAIKEVLAEAREKRAEIEDRYKTLVAEGKIELAGAIRDRLMEDLEKTKEKAHKKTRFFISQFPTCTSYNNEIKQQLDNIRAWKKNAKEELKKATDNLKNIPGSLKAKGEEK